MRLIAKKALNILLLTIVWICIPANAAEDDIIKLRFVDSTHQPIPYFSRHFQFVQNDGEKAEFQHFAHDYPWDELLPYQEIGGGIMPIRSDNDPYFVDTIYISFEFECEASIRKQFLELGFPDLQRILIWYFPNGQIYTMTLKEVDRLRRKAVNEIQIKGDLGSGEWKKLGSFLFDAAYFWRAGRGNRNSLLCRCDEMISRKQGLSDEAWVANLVFVRGHWLGGRAPGGRSVPNKSAQTKELDQELPWHGLGREFGREGATVFSYPLKPYFVFKEVLTHCPTNPRALFWTEMLPWVNGFSLSKAKSDQAFNIYIQKCKQIYHVFSEKMDCYHKLWFLKEFLQTCHGMTFEARHWLKQRNVAHDADLNWALIELNEIFKQYPVLRYQVPELKSWLVYMKDEAWADPLRPRP